MQYRLWAHEEAKIDFLNDAYLAERCTLSYAAEEIVNWLTEAGLDISVSDGECDLTIEISSKGGEGEEFSIIGGEKCIKLIGVSRKATLYAVYKLLDRLILPEKREYSYDMPYGRGYHFEGLLKESFKIAVWMARNRMSLSAPYAYSVPLLRKLGATLKKGGHVLTEIINPEKYTENGELYVDAHRDWYGKRTGEITKHNALEVQFCVTNEEVLSVISDAIVERCRGE